MPKEDKDQIDSASKKEEVKEEGEKKKVQKDDKG